MQNVNWDAIKADYLKGGISIRKLSDKYNISYSTIRRVSERESWRQAREKVQRKAGEKVAQKIASERAQMLNIGYDVGFSMLRRLKYIVDNVPDTLATKTQVEASGGGDPGSGRPTSGRTLSETDFAKLCAMYSGIMKTLGFDEASRVSREHLQLEKGKFELEQRRANAGGDEFNATILSLADLINHPSPNRTIDDIERMNGEDGGND